jgi:hypothetical protein
MMNSALNPIQTALLLHRDGKLEQAEVIYRRILDGDSEHAEALHLLGLLIGAAQGIRARDRTDPPGDRGQFFRTALLF